MKRLVLGLALALGVTGCLTFADDDGPIMAIELFWEHEPDADEDEFVGGTCLSARVDTMEWALYDDSGELVDGREEPCADAIDVIEPRHGEYELEISGFDRDGEMHWSVTCEGLQVSRFDVAYACDIPYVP